MTEHKRYTNVINFKDYRRRKNKAHGGYKKYVSLLELQELFDETDGLIEEIKNGSGCKDNIQKGQLLLEEYITRMKYNSDKAIDLLSKLQVEFGRPAEQL